MLLEVSGQEKHEIQREFLKDIIVPVMFKSEKEWSRPKAKSESKAPTLRLLEIYQKEHRGHCG